MNKLTPRAVIASLALMLSFSLVQAADESTEDMTRLLKLRLGTDQVEPAVPTGVEGVYQTRFGNKFAYLIGDGRYVFIGDLVVVVEELASFSEEKLIVFPADNEELAVLNVFTDTSCGYCQQLHKEVKYLQEAGISVHYFPYPRGGNRGPGYSDLQKVWCADDKLAAMSIAKGASAGSLTASNDCESARYVDEGYLLGNRIGVTGTPALYKADGTMFNGYVPYQQLIPQLVNQ
jgi:thiol:disulfide interchange protein DsbC